MNIDDAALGFSVGAVNTSSNHLGILRTGFQNVNAHVEIPATIEMLPIISVNP
jgi:hypothetical protein